ncbi:MAG: OsmC family protein [Acidobacteria bacterium]|nr:OsmC family protein [Acidobacteriota bacterium]
MAERPSISTELTWQDHLFFSGRTGGFDFWLDGDTRRAPSPMQALAAGLAGCMAIDLVDMLTKGRHDFRGLRATFTGLRAPEPPKRFQEITLHYVITGNVPSHAVERAIALSREKYCSVWHSMREDIELRVTYEVGT